MGKKKRIIINETQFITLVGDFITEQEDLGARKLPPPSPPPQLPPHKLTCLPNSEIMIAVETALGLGLDPLMIKHGLAILGRESDYGAVFGRYGVKAIPEYLINKASESSPTFATIVQWGAKKFYDKSNWVPSMGIAQMTPAVAKQYNINLEELMDLSGSLIAATKHLTTLYSQTQKYYDTNTPSIIIHKAQLIKNPSSSGNAALDAAILSYNLGSSRLRKYYCQTNAPDFLAPCNAAPPYYPYPKDRPDLKLNIYKNRIVKNYLPNIKTKTGSIVAKGLDKLGVKENKSYISTLGYVKEVVRRAKGFGCIS